MRAARSFAAAVALAAIIGLASEPAMGAGAPKQFFGVQPLGSPSPQQAARIAAGGVGSVRIPVSWREVQQQPGQPFNWAALDTLVERMAPYGIEVVPVLYETQDALGGRLALPTQTAAQRSGWAAFLDAAVRRYGPGGQFWAEHGPGSSVPLTEFPIRIWQIWNEENTTYFTARPNPRQYAALLKASNATIKAVDPGATVIIGGLLSRPANGAKFKGAVAAQKYLDALYKVKGVKATFDGVAVHSYVTNAGLLLPVLRELRAIMRRHGDRKTSTYLTEVGWGSGKGKGFGKGMSGQAKELSKAFNLMVKNRRKLKLQRVHWFSLTDAGPGLCVFCDSTGLFTAAFDPKPSWFAFARAAGGTP